MSSNPRAATVLLVCTGCLVSTAPQLRAQQALLEVVRHEVPSEALGRPVSIVVHLPSGYEESQDRHPVYYHLGAESRSRFALIASTMEVMAGSGEFPPVILVGIELPDGNGVLIPPCSERFENGQAGAHLAFLTGELTPFIDARYRTQPFRILAGASNSGLFAIHAMLSEPTAFRAYFAWSPGIGWCSEDVVARTKALSGRDGPAPFLYVDYGQDDYANLVKDALPAFVEAARSLGREKLDLVVEEVPGGGHVPVQGYYAAPKALLPELYPSRDRVAASLDELVSRYAAVSRRLGFDYPVPAGQLFDLGADYVVVDEDYEKAERVFRHLIDAYPGRAGGYAGMAFTKLRSSELDQASEWADKALQVDPGHGFARRIRKRVTDAQAEK